MHEIILPDDQKPYSEWINNRIVPKVSPDRSHSLAQARFVAAFDAWARTDGKGTAGTEWRFLVQPEGEIARTLVPDVAYLSYRRMPKSEQETTALPRVAPDAVVEVRSPADRHKDIEEKILVYLSAGTDVIFLVDTRARTVTVIDRNGRRTVSETGHIEHAALPGLRFDAGELFRSP